MNEAVKRIAEMVEKEGSQKAVAEKLGITPAYLHDILHEQTHVSERIAKMLGLHWMLIPDDPRLEAYLHKFIKAPEGTKGDPQFKSYLSSKTDPRD
jgi:hypothetical protein